MPGLTPTSQIYIPSIPESQAMLSEVKLWIRELKSLNVSADIAAYITRDFLSPMRIVEAALPDLANCPGGKGEAPPNEQVICPTPPLLEIEE
jgi:hypothetical protein